jgi:hypothetical protein
VLVYESDACLSAFALVAENLYMSLHSKRSVTTQTRAVSAGSDNAELIAFHVVALGRGIGRS